MGGLAVCPLVRWFVPAGPAFRKVTSVAVPGDASSHGTTNGKVAGTGPEIAVVANRAARPSIRAARDNVVLFIVGTSLY